jgi:hypothetical protein
MEPTSYRIIVHRRLTERLATSFDGVEAAIAANAAAAPLERGRCS